MIRLLLNGLLAGTVVVVIVETARLWPRLAAILLFVPIAIPVVFLSLYLRGTAIDRISHLSRQALLIIPLSLPMFLPLALAQRLNLSFWAALSVGLVMMAGSIAAYLAISR